MNSSPLSDLQEDELLKKISTWSISREESHTISKKYRFKNFAEALAFVNMVGEIAEKERHHPDIEITYNKVWLSLTSHEVGGLTEEDFLVAGAIDALENNLS